VQVLQVLVQLSDLWAQGAFHQYVDLSTLRYPFALIFRKGCQTKRAA
jgi:hypothetical protein